MENPNLKVVEEFAKELLAPLLRGTGVRVFMHINSISGLPQIRFALEHHGSVDLPHMRDGQSFGDWMNERAEELQAMARQLRDVIRQCADGKYAE